MGELNEIYAGMKQLYDKSRNKEKQNIRNKIVRSLLNFSFHRIECSCGKVFETDREFMEYYVDAIILKLPGKKFDITKCSALAKWQNHKEELERRIDNEHLWRSTGVFRI